MAGSSDAPIDQPSIHERVIERAAQMVFADIKAHNKGVKPRSAPENEKDYLDDRARNLRERSWRLKVGWGLGGLGVAEVVDIFDIVTRIIQFFE